MRSPFTEYYNMPNKAALRKECYTFFNEKYFKKPFENQDDLFDTTERILAKKLNFFLPGRIYTWQYDPIGKDWLDFYDIRPIVLVHSQFTAKNGNKIVCGVNLNFLPEFQRIQTMEIFYKIFKSDLEAAEKAIDKNQIGIVKRAWQFLTDWLFTLKIFNTQGKIGYQWAYRNYIISRTKQPVLIEMEDWPMIPYFVPKEFKGMSPGQVWSEYVKVKDKINKRPLPNTKESQLNQKRFTKPGGG